MKVYAEARKSELLHKEENAWKYVAWDVLRCGMVQAKSSIFEINNVYDVPPENTERS